jgi:preprotein translocase subunit SecB
MEKAAFSLVHYSFDKVNIDYSLKEDCRTTVNIIPKGVFKKGADKSSFDLSFIFTAQSEDNEPFVTIECNAIFEFSGLISFEEVPPFFYTNSIAILFPYIRAFISTVTLQSNNIPVILPTMNLSSLEKELRKNTIEE